MFFLSAFVFFAGAYILLPTFPLILQGREANPAQVGLIMGSFTAAAVVLRIPAGRLLSRVSPIKLLLWGQLATGVGYLLYFPQGLALPIAGRILQGAGLALFTTAAYLYLERHGGLTRRAEYISLFGLSANAAMALSPAAGSLLWQHLGENALYLFGMLLAAVGWFTVPRAPMTPQPSGKRGIWEARALRPSIALFGMALGYGAMLVFTPIAMERRLVPDPWLFFSIYAMVIIMTRIATRRLLDRGSRTAWTGVGSTLMLLGLVILAPADTLTTFLAAAACLGLGVGMSHPSLMALALESAPAEGRGAATAMSTAAFDAGVAIGAILSGAIADRFSLAAAFLTIAALFAAFMLPLFWTADARRHTAVPD
jgi:MFS family permease